MLRSILLLFSIVSIFFFILPFLNPSPAGTPVTEMPVMKERLLLLPLDSRPPCQKLVADNARTAGIEILLPPLEDLDYYTAPGNTQKLAEWTFKNLPQCSGAIISVDQLLYGGLISSRELTGTDNDLKRIVKFFTDLHNANPAKPIYVFSIQPRMTPPSSLEGYHDNKNLMTYSRLLDKASQGTNPLLMEQLVNITDDISPDALKAYDEKFAFTNKLNEALSLLAKQGIITQLTIGQDDGEPFSISNLKLRELECFLAQNNISSDKVFLTHGADEVALSLLGKYILNKNNYTPKIFIDYTDESGQNRIMPFMAVNQEAVIQEKLALSNAVETNDVDEADFILMVHCGDKNNPQKPVRESLARLENYLHDGKRVALVDLSWHFANHETLLPQMLANELPVNSLIAYAGWNTSSNSVGTAIAQGEIYMLALRNTAEPLPVIHSNIKNLTNRFLEDYFYLKGSISDVNGRLASLGYDRYTVLAPASTYPFALNILRQDMKNDIKKLTYSKAYRQPFTIGEYDFTINYLQADTSFPWPRTFEIYVDSQFTFCLAGQKVP